MNVHTGKKKKKQREQVGAGNIKLLSEGRESETERLCGRSESARERNRLTA